MRQLLKKFTKKQQGVAAVEFAIIAPVLMTILLGVVEFSHYQLLSRRFDIITSTSADYLSRDPNNILNINEYRQIRDMWAFVVPNYGSIQSDLISGHLQTTTNSFQTKRVDQQSFAMHSIEMKELEEAERDPDCVDAAHCGLKPVVKWTAGINRANVNGGKEPVSCEASFVEDATAAGPTEIPEGFAGLSSLVSIERRAVYRPLITSDFLPGVLIRRTATRKTRTGYFLESGDDYWMQRNTTSCE